MKFNKLFCGAIFLAIPLVAMADGNANINGSEHKIIEITPDSNTGLNNIFVVYNTTGCNFNFAATNGYTATVSRFSNLGGGYAEEITDINRSSTTLSFPLSEVDMGYIIEDGTTLYYCWVVNYANHKMNLLNVIPASDPDCNYSVLNIEGEAGAINYYTINGQPRVLSREIYVDYTTQEFDKDLSRFKNSDERKIYESLGTTISITPPAFCSSYFIVSGDRFLREWGMETSRETGIVQAVAVDCHTEAIQNRMESEEGSNVIKGDDSALGGSAPADISFYAYTTEGVIHYEWQLGRDPELENPEYRFYQQDIDYTFNEEGTYYMRFIGSNAQGSCETIGDTYTISIGASELKCPNAFSPNDDGVNDIWKVSYRSLIDFHCEIFNRNGQMIYRFDDPSGGWDGTWHGKKVKSGIYYYVIIATGADGKKYKKSGDINIINYIDHRESSGGSNYLE